MEYHRTEDGQIQADMAKRLGKILKQYHDLVSNSKKYEVTLSLAILQTLLTNCVELMNRLGSKKDRDNPLYKSPIDSELWGIFKENILINTFKKDQLNVEFVIRHIRNALCHPTKINFDSEFQSTGYSTIESGSDRIENIYFVNSPDVDKIGKRRSYSQHDANKILRSGTFPNGVVIQQVNDGLYSFSKDENPFCRIFKITFTPKQITQLAFGLSNYLAQPLIEKWDGKTFIINKLVA